VRIETPHLPPSRAWTPALHPVFGRGED